MGVDMLGRRSRLQSPTSLLPWPRGLATSKPSNNCSCSDFGIFFIELSAPDRSSKVIPDLNSELIE